MPVDIITTVVTPAESYDLTSLANVKLDLAIKTGLTLTTSADTPSGQVLPFLATTGVALKQAVNGPNIAAGVIVSAFDNATVTLSAAIDGDIPSGSAIIFGADTSADAFLARAITLSSAAVQNYCGRQFPVETIQDQINFLDGRNAWQSDNSLPRLQLSKGPLISVTSVVVTENGNNTTLTEGTDYILDLDKAQLIRINTNTGRPMNWRAEQTTVIYVAGFAVIPADIDDACSRMTKKAFWARGRDPSIMEQNQGMVGSTKYWVVASPEGNLPPEICDILDKYRQIVFA